MSDLPRLIRAWGVFVENRSKGCLFSVGGSLLLAGLTGLAPSAVRADLGDCSQPVSTGADPVARDCLFLLGAALGLETCTPACICAPGGSLPPSASDALACLNAAVGNPATLNCPCGGGTTTTMPAAASGSCPTRTESFLFEGTNLACASDADCIVGTCDGGLGRCVTGTELDNGWTGIAHDADLMSLERVIERISCEASEAPCGSCTAMGLDWQAIENCRCQGANRTICDEPFANDADDCGGGACVCYVGPPLPLSAGNTPACIVNRMNADSTGTVDVDLGGFDVAVDLSSVVYLGESIVQPCPYCTGDATIGDGVRDGTCVDGRNDGLPCDADALSSTFPAPGGDGHSLDCFPSSGKNVSGVGLQLAFDLRTGAIPSLTPTIECGFPPLVTKMCQCGLCDGNPSIPCSSDNDCPGDDTCGTPGAGQALPNQCGGAAICDDIGGGEGQCAAGPIDRFCDAVVRANGVGFIQCIGDEDCNESAIGIAAGNCELEKPRPCFLSEITATGTPDPRAPLGAALFCIPQTSNPGINGVAGLPGPGRLFAQFSTTPYCDRSLTNAYIPGIGGCP